MRLKTGAVFFALAVLFAACVSTKQIRDFSSDGCSLFPDGNLMQRNLWCDCCFTHDIAYWRGGTEKERLQADADLQQCVTDRTKNKVLGLMMYRGVRAGGHPAFPVWYRWGYGWNYGRGYEPLTEAEQEQAREKLKLYRAKRPEGYCKEKKKERL